MDHPVPPHRALRHRAPSITRLFFATFFSVALAGLTIALLSWVSAQNAERDVPSLLETLDRLEATSPSPTLQPERDRIRALAEDLGDSTQQAALATTIVLLAVLASLGIGLLYSRRRLAEPLGRSSARSSGSRPGNTGRGSRRTRRENLAPSPRV